MERMGRIRGLIALLLTVFFVSGCVPFFGSAKEYRVHCINKVERPCYVKPGENPCKVCPNVKCKGGKKDD